MNPNLLAPGQRVAIIGAGPAGLTAARWLRARGFDPQLFEAAARPGGQWNPDSPGSGTWAGMHTNTSRVLSAFSDLAHPPGTASYPTQEQMLAYLDHYASVHGLAPRVHVQTVLERLSRAEDGWRLRLRGPAGLREELFAAVVVATGRQATAASPMLPGLPGAAGLEVLHAQRYRGAERFRGRDVVVAGGSVSALELAADLAVGGAASVTLSSRRQRYVLPKLIGSVPTDHVMFTRAAALAARSLPPEALRAQLAAMLARTGADPSLHGAPAPHADPFVAGLTQSQLFLPLLAEGRIRVRSWIRAVEGRRIHFEDGASSAADVLLLGTGYRLHLPFLDEELARVLEPGDDYLGLHERTFHPALPRLAFIGLYDQTGPLLPVLELQARWVAQVFAGIGPAPTVAAMNEGLALHRARREGPQGVLMHDMAVRFAELAGVLPELDRWPALERALLFGPLTPAMFRLQGPDALADAPARVLADAAAFGAIASPALTEEETALRSVLKNASTPAQAA